MLKRKTDTGFGPLRDPPVRNIFAVKINFSGSRFLDAGNDFFAKVDLPPPFGPVITLNLWSSSFKLIPFKIRFGFSSCKIKENIL